MEKESVLKEKWTCPRRYLWYENIFRLVRLDHCERNVWTTFFTSDQVLTTRRKQWTWVWMIFRDQTPLSHQRQRLCSNESKSSLSHDNKHRDKKFNWNEVSDKFQQKNITTSHKGIHKSFEKKVRKIETVEFGLIGNVVCESMSVGNPNSVNSSPHKNFISFLILAVVLLFGIQFPTLVQDYPWLDHELLYVVDKFDKCHLEHQFEETNSLSTLDLHQHQHRHAKITNTI